ncbi:putative phage domain protein [Yersinia pestis PY-19]|nr:putative phage domain protein [Yersinia pestis PY-19]
MDSLRIRGKNVFDYENWNDALTKKALTYKDIHTVVTKIVSKGNSDLNFEAIKYILDDLNLKGTIKAKIIQKINSYSLTLLSPTLAIIKAQKEIQELLKKNSKKIEIEMSYELLERLIIDLSKDTIGLFEDNISISSAIIYEMVEATN